MRRASPACTLKSTPSGPGVAPSGWGRPGPIGCAEIAMPRSSARPRARSTGIPQGLEADQETICNQTPPGPLPLPVPTP